MGKGNPLIIVPAFNEAERITSVLQGIKKNLAGADILVVNDGSTDNTAAVASKEGVMVINLPFNLGVGAALQTGFKYAVCHGYQVVIQMDADGQHDPVYLLQFLQALEESGADLVIGSRFLLPGKFPGSWIRLAGIKIFSFLVLLATGKKLTDPTSGYRAMRRDILEFFCRDFFPQDYPDADLLIAICRAGYKVLEIPVVMKKRISGQSLHAGLRPLYYIFKMFLSVFVTMLRRH